MSIKISIGERDKVEDCHCVNRNVLLKGSYKRLITIEISVYFHNFFLYADQVINDYLN